LSYIFLAVTVIVVAINLKATLVLARSTSYSQGQKWVQLGLIWLAPVVGAILVWSLAEDRQSERVITDLSDKGGIDDGQVRHDHASFDAGGGGEGGGGD